MTVLSLDATTILHDFDSLEVYKPSIERTLTALELNYGQRYVSVGIGKNVLPLLIAFHGIEVIGMDVRRYSIVDPIEFQKSLAEKYASLLQATGGSISVMEMDIDRTPSSEIPSNFDLVECVNFQHNYDERDIAQTLVFLGKPNAKFLVSLFGGPRNENNGLVLAIQSEAENLGRRLRIAVPDLYSSTVYHSTASLLVPY